jgi:SAM-dependent methyltransferase
VSHLCDPVDGSDLTLVDPVVDDVGAIRSGELRSSSGARYPIVAGIPRFIGESTRVSDVAAFGVEWNYFNFDDFKLNWLRDTVANTFGTDDAFRGKVIVDAGGGSGMQSKWMRELGADYVICLELSEAVDDVIPRNLRDTQGVDVVQCSIDRPPLKASSIDGMVICHNVIQHTPSVEATARALWNVVAPGGEFVFNCYPRNDRGWLRSLRFRFYLLLRRFLSKRSFGFRLAYARVVALLRFIPVLGVLLEKAGFVSRGHIPSGTFSLRRAYRQAVLNTYDLYGAHTYQHHKTDEELRALVAELQPDASKIENADAYFAKPPPVGCALRLRK